VVLSTRNGFIYWLDHTRLVQRQPSYKWEDLPCIGNERDGVRWASWLAVPAPAAEAPR
jgi:hypothetical protein